MIEEPNALHHRTMGIMETEVVVDEGDTVGIAVVEVIAVEDHTAADATKRCQGCNIPASSQSNLAKAMMPS